MAQPQGTVYNVLQDLLDAMERVKFNVLDETTSAFIQKNDKDIIVSLWNRASGTTITDITHADLLTLANANGLVPGAVYRLSHQTKHQIPYTSVINVDSPQFVASLEDIIVTASSTSEISGLAVSETNRFDILSYNFRDILCEDSTTPREGRITYRRDTLNNIEAYEDWRQTLKRRFQVDGTGMSTWSIATVYQKGDTVFVGGDGVYLAHEDHTSGGAFAGDITKWVKILDVTGSLGGYVAPTTTFTLAGGSVEANPATFQDYKFLRSGVTYENVSVGKPTGNLNNIVLWADAGQTVNSVDISDGGVDFTFDTIYARHIDIDSGASGLYFYSSCENVTVDSTATNVSFGLVNGLVAGTSLGNCSITATTNYTRLGNNVSNSHISDCSSVEIKSNMSSCYIIRTDNTFIGVSMDNSSIKNSEQVTVGNSATLLTVVNCDVSLTIGNSIVLSTLTDSDNVTIGNNCGFIGVTNSNEARIGNRVSSSSITDSNGSEIKDGSTTVVISSASSNNVVGEYCSSITITDSSNNSIGNSCSSVTLTDSNTNFIENGCSNITLKAGGSYATSENNHIGVGSTNIDIAGRGNYFGPKCETITCTGTDIALIDCIFLGNVGNQTFTYGGVGTRSTFIGIRILKDTTTVKTYVSTPTVNTIEDRSKVFEGSATEAGRLVGVGVEGELKVVTPLYTDVAIAASAVVANHNSEVYKYFRVVNADQNFTLTPSNTIQGIQYQMAIYKTVAGNVDVTLGGVVYSLVGAINSKHLIEYSNVDFGAGGTAIVAKVINTNGIQGGLV